MIVLNKKYIVQFYYEGKNVGRKYFDDLEDATIYVNENRHKYYKNI